MLIRSTNKDSEIQYRSSDGGKALSIALVLGSGALLNKNKYGIAKGDNDAILGGYQ
jgi:hypothetical protein